MVSAGLRTSFSAICQPSFFEGKQVIPLEEHVQKLRAAQDARRDPDFVIIARTDALAVTGWEDVQQLAQGAHPAPPPARHSRARGQPRGAALELGTALDACLCTGYGARPLGSTGHAADHRGPPARRGGLDTPPAAEARGGPAPAGPGACPPSSLRLDRRRRSSGVAGPPPGALARRGHPFLG